MHVIKRKKSKNGRAKNIKYYIDKHRCWICVSHARNRGGYPRITNKNSKQMSMSRYMYMRFVGKIPKGLLVRHKCDNPACINPAHLETGTYQDNANDMVKRGRQAIGEKIGCSKLTNAIVTEIRKDAESTFENLAKKFGVAQSVISGIKNGRAWGHVKGVFVKTERGSTHWNAKLTENDVITILKSDLSHEELAGKYGVSKSCIYNVKNRISWKHVVEPIKGNYEVY